MNIRSITSSLISFFMKIVSFLWLVLFWLWPWRKKSQRSNIADRRETNPTENIEDEKRQNKVNPCLERLQRLEKLFEELSDRPVAIPPEREDLLQESIRRIKSVECDLEKTKRVSNDLLY